METVFEYSELCLLLAKAGVNAPVGVAADHFPPITDVGQQANLPASQSVAEGQALVEVLTNPTAVLHATRIEVDKPDEDIWYFYTPTQIVRMQKAAEKQYQLTVIPGAAIVLEQIQQFAPLQPVQPDLTYRITVDEEEFENLRDLASAWVEVPSLATLEADGLDSIGAKELFDSAVAPQWRCIIDFMRTDNQEVAAKHTVRALQGQNVAWLIRSFGPDDSKVLIEAAQAGELNRALTDSWRLITSD